MAEQDININIENTEYILSREGDTNYTLSISGSPSYAIELSSIGSRGKSGTVTVGSTTTLPAGSNATVDNVGTEVDAVFNFGIPKGEDGIGAGDMSASVYDPAGGAKQVAFAEDVSTSLNNKVDKVTGKGLSTNDFTDTLLSNYNTAYSQTHTHPNKTILDNTSESFTTLLKSGYDGSVTNSHTHSNKTILDAIQESLTTTLKSNYDTAYTNTHTHSNKSSLDLVTNTNTGDETNATIKSKLGVVSGSNEGYVTPAMKSKWDLGTSSLANFHDATELSDVQPNDEFVIYDESFGGYKKIRKANINNEAKYFEPFSVNTSIRSGGNPTFITQLNDNEIGFVCSKFNQFATNTFTGGGEYVASNKGGDKVYVADLNKAYRSTDGGYSYNSGTVLSGLFVSGIALGEGFVATLMLNNSTQHRLQISIDDGLTFGSPIDIAVNSGDTLSLTADGFYVYIANANAKTITRGVVNPAGAVSWDSPISTGTISPFKIFSNGETMYLYDAGTYKFHVSTDSLSTWSSGVSVGTGANDMKANGSNIYLLQTGVPSMLYISLDNGTTWDEGTECTSDNSLSFCVNDNSLSIFSHDGFIYKTDKTSSLSWTYQDGTRALAYSIPSISGLAIDGVWNIICEKGSSSAIVTTSAVTQGSTFPLSPTSGDYFTDTSVTPYCGYNRVGSIWVEKQFVKFGTVTVVGAVITAISIYPLNNPAIPLTTSNISDTTNKRFCTDAQITAIDSGLATTTLGNIVRATALTNLGFSGYLFNANGYYKFPNGLIIQWGTYTTSLDGVVSYNYPIAFPNSCLCVFANVKEDGTAYTAGHSIFTTTNTASAFNARRDSSIDGSHPFYMVAIGY